MDIEAIVSEGYTEFSPETRVSKFVGAFDDATRSGVVVRGEEFWEKRFGWLLEEAD
ncbi:MULTISPECIES: hypothetical protein [Haloarcula]|uniref:hypothetical protein n=1 Tax=Haloarcula TaxID=2237 RepID=UPI0023ED4CA5|nr:hypothetical protein [Halomicroarcula sp. XH51]